MGDEPGGAGEDGNGANEAGRYIDVPERRGDGHRHVHRQRLAPDLRRRLGESERSLDRAPGDAALARESDHPLGARIDGLVQRMAVSGKRLAALAIFARDVERSDIQAPARVDATEHVLDHLPAEIGRAEYHRTATQHAGGDRALKRRRIGVVGHTRRLDRWREPVLGESNQTQIEKKALFLGRLAAGRQQENIFREGRATHELFGEIPPAHHDPVARRGRDRGLRGSRLADQHGVPSRPGPSLPAESEWV